jgi:hypothetical protein
LTAAVVLALAAACSKGPETGSRTDTGAKTNSAAPGTVTPASLGLRDDCDLPAFVLNMLSLSATKSRAALQPGEVADTSDFPDKVCIREWNDLQKLYEQCRPNCADEYGPLAYVVADDDLDTWTNPGDFATAKRVAVIFIKGAYEDLHLREGSNSLYVRYDSAAPAPKRWTAWMNDSTSTLEIMQYDPESCCTNAADFPGIARWDWNKNDKNQVIGVKCGNGWCEIGKKVKKEPPVHAGGKTRRIKGWHDAQRLAIDAGNGKLKPGMSTPATVFPIENLEALKDTADFKDKWVKVATVKSDTSYERLKIPYNPKDSSELSIMYDSQAKKWNAKMSSRDTTGTTIDAFFEVRMMPHINPQDPSDDRRIPGVARWGWEADDESIWTRCANGCCQLTEFVRLVTNPATPATRRPATSRP